MAEMTTSSLLFLLTLAVPVGWGQINNNAIQRDTYYLDSNADCNMPVWELYGQTVKVKGHGAIQEQQGPTSCTITLRSVSNFDHTNLLLSVVAANIHDCDVQLVVYDGDAGQGTLRGYDCNTPSMANERNLVTTGDVVTFVMSRKNVLGSQFDIEINVTPLISGTQPGYENDYGDVWGYFREKLENDIAIGIVAAAFSLVVILVVLAIILCYRRYLGMNKPWERHELSTFRPAHSIYETKSKMSDTSTEVWVSNASRTRVDPPAPSRHRIEPAGRMARPSEDEDSVFDDEISPKKHMAEEDRRWEMDRERERRRRREREREGSRGRRRDNGSDNSSYVQADDDHPQSKHGERVVEPRSRAGRIYKPPSYEEAINESETEKSDSEEDDSDDVGKQGTSEEESEKLSSEEEEEEDEEEAEDGNGAAAPKPAPRPSTRPPPPPSGVPLQPGMHPYPGYPPPMGYGYPMPPPGQFVPIMAAPHPAQRFPAAGPGHPPPRYPGQRPADSVRPTEPPIYSYLVQRGYTPLEPGQERSANSSRSQNSLDEVDRNVASSGVEYMRR